MRILFLDDDMIRTKQFVGNNVSHDVVAVETAQEAIDQLANPQSFDIIHLDHDLGELPFVTPKDKNTGMEVARWLCENPQVLESTQSIVIHSLNPAGRANMYAELMRRLSCVKNLSRLEIETVPFGWSREY